MDPPVADTLRGRAAALVGLLGNAPGRFGRAARLALVCTLTAWIAVANGTPEASLSAYVAFFLCKEDRAASALTAVVMALLISLVLGLVVLLAQGVLSQPALRLSAMAALSFGLLFLASASRLQPVANTVALIVAYCLDLLGSVPAGEFATRGLLYAWLAVAIPAAVTLAVSLPLAPAPGALARRALAQRLRAAAAACEHPAPEQAAEVTRLLREGNDELAGHLKLARLDGGTRAAELASLRRAAPATFALLGAVDALLHMPRALPPLPARVALARALGGLAARVERGLPMGEPEFDPAVLPARDGAAGAVRRALLAALRRFSDAPPETASAPAPGGFLRPDAFTRPDHVRYALKTTSAAMFCYLLYSGLDWPGIHTCLITCYIVSLGTVAESVEKLTLRLAGCVAGAAIGLSTLVFVVPSITSLPGFLALVFAGALAAAWIAVGSERVAYAGFQLAFAFFLCVIQGPGPSFDMVVARDRVIGIVIGNLVVYAVSSLVWPASVRTRIDDGIAALARLLGELARSSGEGDRLELAARAQAGLGRVESDLERVLYEPAWVRPPLAWIRSRREAATHAGGLLSAMALLPPGPSAGAQALATVLDRLAPLPQPGGPASPREPHAADPLAAALQWRAQALAAALRTAEPSSGGSNAGG